MNYKLWISAACLCLAGSTFAQQNKPQEQTISMQEKNSAIDSALHIITNQYVFADVAKKMETYIRQQQSKKAYASIKDGNQFAARLTEDLRSVCHDKHLNVEYSAEELPYEPPRELMSIPPAEKEGFGKMLKHVNYGIRKMEVLKGNIGYLDIEFFCTPEFAGDTYAAAMNYLEHTDALILDLRQCSGSTSLDAIPFVCSYFFPNPIHLNDIKWRKDNNVRQAWTYAYVPGKKYLNKPIYVLTSGSTFSGAEELAYDLQNLKRATIIGQTTGGGANPGGYLRVNNHFRMFIPIGQAINPITKTNWEGVGVKPDTVINTKLALYKAQQMAMQHGINTTDEREWKAALQDWIKELDDTKPKFKPVTFELKGYPNAKDVYVAGSFNDWTSTACKMEKKDDKWVVTTDSEPGKITYKFIVDGNWITDPDNPKTQANGPNTDSVKILE